MPAKNIHLAPFIRLFRGRTDVYGMNQLCLKEPLTDTIYEEHLRGIKRIGVYPIFNKQFVQWIACDLDDGDFNKVAALYNKITNSGLVCYLERSKSKGHHIWTFFEKPIEAVKVRLVYEMFLDELEFKCELFPKQDEVHEGYFGNFIFLPLFGGDLVHDRTVFVDPYDVVLHKNTMALEEFKTNDCKLIDEIIEINELKRVRYDLQERPKSIRNLGGELLPCINKMRHGVDAGHRDMACFRIASYYKQQGMVREDVEAILCSWRLNNEKPATYTVKDVQKTVDSVWRSPYRGYGCEDPIVQEYCDQSACPMKNAQEKKQAISEGIISLTFRDAEVMVFKKKNYEFRLTGFEFTKAGKFKCDTTLSRNGKILFRDFANLVMDSHKKRFAVAADDNEIIHDMGVIFDLTRKQLDKEAKEAIEKKKQVYVMTEQEKEEALSFLEKNNDPLSHVMDVTNRMGVVGEEDLRLLVYLQFTSRITKEPLHVTVKGESSSGKSFSCQNVMKLIPEEGVRYVTKATAQAFYHLPEDGLQNKIVYINELPGSESADYSIRSAQSEGDLILMMPIKDPSSGAMETISKTVKGPAGFLCTTTQASIFDENETRNFSVFSDDSPELTGRIKKITARKMKGEKFVIDPKELALWKNIQRILNPDFNVLIPFADEITEAFPNEPVRIRRDIERFRVLIEVITIFHQFHREQKKTAAGENILIATLADYYIAKVIMDTVLQHTINESGPAAFELLGIIQDMAVSFNSITEGAEEFTCTYRTISDKCGWKKSKVKKWAKSLTEKNYLEYAEQGGGKKESVFKLSAIGRTVKGKDPSFLPKVEDLFEKYPCDRSLFHNPKTGKKIDPINVDMPEGLL